MRRLLAVVLMLAALLAACGSSSEGLFGAELYDHSCAGCHGADGSGVGSGVSGAAIGPGSNAATNLTDDQIKGVIRVGPGLMPSYPRLTEAQTDSLVTYLRQLQGVAP